LDGDEEMKAESQAEFEEIFDAIEAMGVASISQLDNATRFTKETLRMRLAWYVKKGKIFRISKDRYATEPQAKISGYTEQRNRLEEQRKASAFAVDFFNKMVKTE
jgi:DeoR/GlpR family transcriptional regulator of sugar metabolism